MNIILGEDRIADVSEKYIVLPLDSFLVAGHPDPVRSYCVLADLSIADLMQIESLRDLHQNLIKNYGLRNWNYCEQAMEHLLGKWNGQLDSFYRDLADRVQIYKQEDPGPEWTPAIQR